MVVKNAELCLREFSQPVMRRNPSNFHRLSERCQRQEMDYGPRRDSSERTKAFSGPRNERQAKHSTGMLPTRERRSAMALPLLVRHKIRSSLAAICPAIRLPEEWTWTTFRHGGCFI